MTSYLIKTAVCLFLLLSFNTCTIFKKSIPKAVIIALPDTLFTSTINSTAPYTKYINIITAEEVVTAFLKGFKQEAKYTSNVTLQFNTEGADFILKLNYLRVTESSKTQKIDDPKSQYNGQEVILNSVSVSADLDIVNVKNPTEKLSTCYNNKERAESETNKRDIGDLISGSNKDNTQYKTKLLNDKIAVSLSEDVGRRIWVPITRRIAKKLK
jgi:hypothetical protein